MMTTDRHPRPRRFSEGVERLPDLASSARVGTFADGPATTGDDPVGTFADGLVLRPDAPSVRRVGTFADHAKPRVADAPLRPHLRVPRGRPRPQVA